MASVALQNLSKSFPGSGTEPVTAVRDLCLEVADREFLVLVGPSGCGKTTTLRMIAGLETVSCGTILIDGVKVNDVSPKDRDIGMVFQNYALYPHLTVYDNMAFGLKLRRFGRAEIQKRVMEAADWLGLTGLLRRKPGALSGGQRQRVAVGRALVRKPKVFLFDEPLSNLDARMREQMRAELLRLHRRLGATMIYVTHDQVEAMTMGDRIVVMREGRALQVAPPLEIYRRPADRFVAGFIGSPPMNFFPGRLVTHESGLRFVPAPAPAPPGAGAGGRLPEGWAGPLREYLDRPLLAGVRPEDIQLLRDDGAPEAGAVEMRAVVELVETLGAETLVHLSRDGLEFTARLPGLADCAAGAEWTARWHPRRACFFDDKTGLRIAPKNC